MKNRYGFILPALLAGATSASAFAAPPTEAQQLYRAARQEARVEYQGMLRTCRQHASADEQACRTEARQQYDQNLAAARELFIAAKQFTPLDTPMARFENARRETLAAYEHNKNQCQEMDMSERAACMRDAKERFNYELLQARAELARERLAVRGQQEQESMSGTSGDSGDSASAGSQEAAGGGSREGPTLLLVPVR